MDVGKAKRPWMFEAQVCTVLLANVNVTHWICHPVVRSVNTQCRARIYQLTIRRSLIRWLGLNESIDVTSEHTQLV